MICPHCGKEVSNDTNYCPSCGEDLRRSNSTSEDAYKYCKFCGAKLLKTETHCPFCNNELEDEAKVQFDEPQNDTTFSFDSNANSIFSANPTEIGQKKVIAAVLAFFLGIFGVQFFYLNKPGLGIACLLFFWTGVPAIIGVITGILFLVMSDKDFEEKYLKH